MNRLYVVESSPTLTGAKAEHRLPLRASRNRRLRAALAAAVGAGAAQRRRTPAPGGDSSRSGSPRSPRICRHIAAGRWSSPASIQPAAVHALAHAMNQALGNVGATVTYGPPHRSRSRSTSMRRSRSSSTAMDAGQVQLLVILGDNPVFTAPADLKFAERLAKVGAGRVPRLYLDETSELAHWNMPADAPARELGRSARLRRHGDDHPAADRAALRRALGARSARGAHVRSRPQDARYRQGLLDARVQRRRRMDDPQRAGTKRSAMPRRSGSRPSTTASFGGPRRTGGPATPFTAGAQARGSAGARARRPQRTRQQQRNRDAGHSGAAPAEPAPAGSGCSRADPPRRRPPPQPPAGSR